MANNDDDKKNTITTKPNAGWKPVSAQLEALLANEPVTQGTAPAPAPVFGSSTSEPRSTRSSKTISELGGPPSPSLPPRKSDKLRLFLAGLVGALLASVVFLTLELLRPPREAAIPPPPKHLLAVPTTPGVPFDPDDPTGAPVQPGAGAGQGLGGIFGQLQQQMQQALKGFGRGGSGGPNTFSFRLGGDDADLDVQEEAGAVVVVAKVKDAIADKFDIQVNGRMFTLRGERRIGGGAMTGTMSFSKSISLPADVDTSKMTSEVKDGALRVRLPKK